MPHSHRRTLPLYAAYSGPKSMDNARSSGLIWKWLMYNTNTGTKSRAKTFDKYTAHASKYSRRLRYMGLRVKRNVPLVTRDEVAVGLVGLIVVFTRLKETMLARPTTRPTEAMTRATPTRGLKGTSTGATRDANHMRKPRSSATAGGGTFSSSELIATKVGHNALALACRVSRSRPAGLRFSTRENHPPGGGRCVLSCAIPRRPRTP